MTLEVRNLSFSYAPGRKVFHDVSFALSPGEILTILGPNGAGKSTLLNCIANLSRPSSGEVLLDGQPIGNHSLREIARCIGYVPQNHAPAYAYRVRDFVAMGRAPYLKTFQQPGAADYRIVDSILEEMGLAPLAERPYDRLSGGERQQAAIARARVQQPRILLLDEPTNHLDYGNQFKTLAVIHSLSQKGYGVILTSHNPDHIMLLESRAGVLSREGDFATGRAEEILTDANLCALYQSEIHVVYVDSVGRDVCIPGRLA